MILLIPILGLAFYLISRPDLANIKHDSETNNYYAHGYYELMNDKHNELKDIQKEAQSKKERKENE